MAEEEEEGGGGGAAPAGGSVLKKYGPLAAIVLLAQVVLAWVVIQFTMKDVQQGGDEGEQLLSETVTEGLVEEDVTKDLPYYFPDGEMLSKITFNPAGTNAERFSVISITLGLSGTTEEGGMKPEEIGADPVVTAKVTEHINLIKAKALKLLRSKTIDQLNSENMPDVGKELRDVLNSEVFDKIKWDEDDKKKIKVQEILFQGIIVQ